MFKVAALALVFAASFAQAQDCVPVYAVEYASCAHASHGTQVATVTTDWILVNKGARRVSDALCTEHIGRLQGQNPTASNIKFNAIDDRDATFRGVGKRDVYCNYKMDIVVTVTRTSPACGIQNVVSSCFAGVDNSVIKACIEKVPASEEDQWTKASCLISTQKFATQIKGLDEVTYNAAKFQLLLMKDTLAYARTPNDAKLLQWIKLQTTR